MEYNTNMDDENFARAQYIAQQKEELQSNIVNFKSATTSTTCKYNWTYRNTGCDIISIITTTTVKKNGDMKDLKIYNKEMKRIRGPVNKLGGKSYRNPLGEEGDNDGSIAKKRLHDMLKEEKNSFMTKLKKSRDSRMSIEYYASVGIQKQYRGHYTRVHIDEIVERFRIQKSMRQLILRQISNNNDSGPLLLSIKRENYIKKRNENAIKIQSLFRRYVCRMFARRREREMRAVHLIKHVLAIQGWIRGAISMRKVLAIRERHLSMKRHIYAVKVQAAYRSVIARRKIKRRWFILRWLSARMIQNWFRVVSSKRMVKALREAWIMKKRYRGAVGVQRVIQGFLGRRRADRIKLRKIYLKIFSNCCKIQRIARGYLSRKYIKLYRQQLQSHENHKTTIQPPPASKKPDDTSTGTGQSPTATDDKLGLSQLDDEAVMTLLAEADIFNQAKAGNTRAVSDLFSGRSTDEVHTTTEVDINGDTILTIAAMHGYLDLLRKCLLWGFDINHRNESDNNALILAIKSGHVDVVNYILNPPSVTEDEGDEEKPETQVLKSISNEDMGLMFVAAAEIGHIDLIVMLDAQGFEVNSKHPITGVTALHVACARGDHNMMRLLFKLRADWMATDEMGQLPLHKACTQSPATATLLLDLGIGPREDQLNEEIVLRRAQALKTKDTDGKDCLLVAALAGQIDVIKMILEELGPHTRDAEEEYGWTPNDVNRMLSLSQHGDIFSLQQVLDSGFDPSWAQDETGTTMAMVAALTSQRPVLDLLLNRSTPLDQVDSQGRTVLHYAAASKDAGLMVSFILMHPKAAACKLDQYSLTHRDKKGRSVIYTAAACGGGIRLDLIAAEGIRIALDLRDDMGLTPLMVAVRGMREIEVKHFLRLGADPDARDNKSRNALWHLYHRTDGATGPVLPLQITLAHCDAFPAITKSTTASSFQLYADEDAVKILEMELTVTLLKGGCKLYSSPLNVPPAGDEPTDLAAKHGNLNFFKALPEVVPSSVCWRAVLSCIRFEMDGCKSLFSLFDGGAIPLLTKIYEELGVKPPGGGEESSTNGNSSKDKDKVDARARLKLKSDPVSNSLAVLNGIFFEDFSLLAWTIKIGNITALTLLMQRGMSPTVPSDIQNNNCLHIALINGNVPAITTIISSGFSLRLEQLNKKNRTAVMEGALAGQVAAVTELCKLGGDPRRGLAGKYWGWLLAIVRRKEEKEQNLQTGTLFGEDDLLYFPLSPDPNYLVHYSLT